MSAYPVLDRVMACRERGQHKVETTEFGACAACGEYGDGPTWVKACEAPGCGGMVARYRGESDVTCDNGEHSYNAGGQRLRDNWRNNPAWGDDDMDDMEGYEREMLGYEGGF